MFQLFGKKYLGVDIGTSAIRVVEISSGRKLENYGEISFKDFDKPFIAAENNALILSEDNIARALLALLSEAQIKSREAYFSLADFATFFTTFSMPILKPKEMEQAVKYEAKKYIPIPLDNVFLDWQIIGELKDPKAPQLGQYKILAIAITKEIVDQYQRVAAKAGIKLIGFEPEVFPLARALMKGDKSVSCVIDVGTKSTTVSIIEGGIIKDSHSLSFSSGAINAKAAKDLSLDVAQIEALKEEQGIAESSRIFQSAKPLLNVFAGETGRLFKDYQRVNGKQVQKILLAGGLSQMPGFKDFIVKNFPMEGGVEFANAFVGLGYPKSLEENLRKLSPQFAIAVGLALKAAES